MRLIDADKLRGVLADYQNNISPWFDEDNTEWNAVELCMEYLDEQPTLDVEPVIHAHWIGKPIAGYATIECSKCGKRIYESKGDYNYCPYCKAKMDEE